MSAMPNAWDPEFALTMRKDLYMIDWEILERGARSMPGTPSVGIQANKGNLSLNLEAYEALGKPQAVQLLMSRDQRLIGLRKAEPSATTYPVHQMNKSHTYLIAGKALAQAMDIDTTKPRRYDAKLDGDVLVVDLNRGTDSTQGPSRRGENATAEPRF